MFSRVNDPEMYLIEITDLSLAPSMQPPIVQQCSAILSQILTWAETFLSYPHPLLGRTGDVCPYTASALRKKLFWLTICRGEHFSFQDIYTRILTYRDWFLDLEPTQGKEAAFKTILLLFPDIQPADAPQMIDAVQRALKPEFVAKGLMIGQFHPHCPEPGLWNQDFRPLQAPIPLLAIRSMVPTDLPFLQQDERFLSAYHSIFGQTRLKH